MTIYEIRMIAKNKGIDSKKKNKSAFINTIKI